MNKTEIIKAYLFLRENNHSIPTETIEFMKDVSIRELKKIKDGRECFNCEYDGFQSVFPSKCTGCGGDGEIKNFKIKSITL